LPITSEILVFSVVCQSVQLVEFILISDSFSLKTSDVVHL